MITNTKEMFAVRFADSMTKLKLFGVKAEITVASGLIMIVTSDKSSASIIRKSIKKIKMQEIVATETRPTKDTSVFAIVC